jgi:hypothetical protein
VRIRSRGDGDGDGNGSSDGDSHGTGKRWKHFGKEVDCQRQCFQNPSFLLAKASPDLELLAKASTNLEFSIGPNFPAENATPSEARLSQGRRALKRSLKCLLKRALNDSMQCVGTSGSLFAVKACICL